MKLLLKRRIQKAVCSSDLCSLVWCCSSSFFRLLLLRLYGCWSNYHHHPICPHRSVHYHCLFSSEYHIFWIKYKLKQTRRQRTFFLFLSSSFDEQVWRRWRNFCSLFSYRGSISSASHNDSLLLFNIVRIRCILLHLRLRPTFGRQQVYNSRFPHLAKKGNNGQIRLNIHTPH